MQPSEITLAVDVANNATLVNRVYTRFDQYQNRTVYVGANHTSAVRDSLAFYRSFPRVSGNFKGVDKTSFKITRDMIVTGVDGIASITAPMILEVSFSLPVGVSLATQLELRQQSVALLDRDDIMTPLNSQLLI